MSAVQLGPANHTSLSDTQLEIHLATQVKTQLAHIIRNIGFDCGSLIYCPVRQLPNNQPGPVQVLASYGYEDEIWLTRWLGEDQQDPLTRQRSPTWRYMLDEILPQRFDLERGPAHVNNTQTTQDWFNTLWQLGFAELCMVPVQLPQQSYLALSCLRRQDSPMPSSLSAAKQARLLYAVHQLADHCLRTTCSARSSTANVLTTPLSHREMQCLHWSSRGKTAAEIANILMIQPETVRGYLKTLLRKLNASNKAHAIGIGYELGILGGIAIP